MKCPRRGAQRASGAGCLTAIDGLSLKDLMTDRWITLSLTALAAATLAPATLHGQDAAPPSSAEGEDVRRAAFTLWWPEYERLVRDFLRNTPAEEGRIALPEPDPESFYRDIEILGRIEHPALEDVALYGVTTDGKLYEALFVVGEGTSPWPLVNRVDPEAFHQRMSNAYVEATNALLDRHRAAASSAEEALALARFTVEVFYNFDYRYRPGGVDSTTFAELYRVRVLRSTDDIPQGLRRFDANGGNALLYGKIPERVESLVTPPRVQSRSPEQYLISFYSWHPQLGELKRWEIRMADGRFVSLKDRTVDKWVSFTVESF